MSIQDPSDYKTGDAVPSGAAMDVNDNAKVFDVFQNAQVPSVKTRPVSYTHLPSPRDRQKSRMPSSA